MTESCGQFDALIARADQLTEQESTRLEAHLAGCEACRELARVLAPDDADVAFGSTMITNDMRGGTRERSETRTDRYRITGEVGRGGIGRVLRALDRVLDRPVALKELFSPSETTRSRFVREALITARLQHPSIVPVYDAGHLGEKSPFYAMKLVAGRPLDQAIAEASTLGQRLALVPTVLAVADAIAYAHNERIIHRDLKPTNILVGKYGETIVIDWGLAKDLAISDRDAVDDGPYRAAGLDHTAVGSMLGTPAYMAPEQAAAEAVDERTDVYALGAILYHVVSGSIPHEGDTLEDVVSRVIGGDVRALAEREPGVPLDLAAIVTKAMALEPDKRYANAQGFADDLRRFLTGQLVASHAYGTRELLRRWIKRHRGAVLVAVAALLVVAAVGIASLVRIVRAQREAEEAAAVATREKNSASETLANMLVEQGRQELLAGRPARAAAYLAEAQGTSRASDVSLRALLAAAIRSVEPLRSLEVSGDELTVAALSSDSRQLATGSLSGTTTVWDPSTGGIVAMLRGHTRTVTSVAFSPDRARIVTASRDRTARLWDARTGDVLATFEHPDKLHSAALSADGSRVITVGRDGIARLWDAKTAKLLGPLEGHGGAVESVAFSADGARIVTASRDHTARVWDAATGKLRVALEGHLRGVKSAVFSPDDTQIVTASDDGTARVWDAGTGKLRVSLEGHRGPIQSATYSPDGNRVVTASEDRSAIVWDAGTGTRLSSLEGHAAAVHAAAFSPDGMQIVTASLDHTAKLWDVPSGRSLASFESHRDDVVSAAFRADGTQVVTASVDGTVKQWDVQPSHARISLLGELGGIAWGQLDPDGVSIVTIGSLDRSARIWDTRTGALLASLEGKSQHVSAMFDAAGARVVTASTDRTARVWDAKTGKLRRSLDHADELRYAMFSPDGGRVATIGGSHGARIWDATTGELVASVATSSGVHDQLHAASFSSDGTHLVTASGSGTVLIWTTGDGKRVAELVSFERDAVHATFSGDGERVVTAGFNRKATVWDAQTGTPLASLEGHTGMLHRARFSLDGGRLVTASEDHTAKLWDSRTGKLLASLDGHTRGVFDAVFSTDGARVVTSSTDRTAKVWDAHNGKLLASVDGHAKDLVDARLSRDGTRIVTASRDGTIWSADVRLEERDHDTVRRIIDAGPWSLSNGVLVPRGVPAP